MALSTGISVQGKLTDRETGQPLSGTITYSPLYPNDNWRTIGDSHIANPAATSLIAKDGTYEITVLPGPGVLPPGVARTIAMGWERVSCFLVGPRSFMVETVYQRNAAACFADGLAS